MATQRGPGRAIRLAQPRARSGSAPASAGRQLASAAAQEVAPLQACANPLVATGLDRSTVRTEMAAPARGSRPREAGDRLVAHAPRDRARLDSQEWHAFSGGGSRTRTKFVMTRRPAAAALSGVRDLLELRPEEPRGVPVLRQLRRRASLCAQLPRAAQGRYRPVLRRDRLNRPGRVDRP